jgi:DNA topoisomerase-1
MSVRKSHDEKYYGEGITRKLINNNFIYYYIKNGDEITNKDLERIKKLKIPPAWKNLWISTDPNATIQAIGVDDKGRKQYRYHQVHIDKAEKEKFMRLIKFIKSLPKIDSKIKEHNNLGTYDKNRVITFMIHLVKEHHMRVGKEIYARTNKSYGISSLRKKHVKIGVNKIKFKFKGKSNQRLQYTIRNSDDINYIKLLMKLDGDKLFQYIIVDEGGKEKIYGVNDRDMNKYIQEYMGFEFSIKDFRTHAANYHFIQALLNETKKRTPKNAKIIKKNIVRAYKSAAYHLKHTKNVSKKSYVMSFAIEMYQNNPEYFIKLKHADTNDVILQLLKIYKKKILNTD